MKVFLDTNVWLSAVIFPGLCESLVMACVERDWLLTSPLVQQEAHQVLARKFPRRADAPALFDLSWSEAQCIADMPTMPAMPDVSDPADDCPPGRCGRRRRCRTFCDWRQAGSGLGRIGLNANRLAASGLDHPVRAATGSLTASALQEMIST